MTTLAAGQADGSGPDDGLHIQYQRIVQIKDEIFAGLHPRIKLPLEQPDLYSHSIASVQPAASQTSHVFYNEHNSNDASTVAPHHPPHASSETFQPLSNGLGNSQHPPRQPAPVALTRSDAIRQERRELEDRLRSQDETSKSQQPSASETIPDFNVATVLKKAQAQARDHAKQEESENESISFDEATLYSSQDNLDLSSGGHSARHDQSPLPNPIVGSYHGEQMDLGIHPGPQSPRPVEMNTEASFMQSASAIPGLTETRRPSQINPTNAQNVEPNRAERIDSFDEDLWGQVYEHADSRQEQNQIANQPDQGQIWSQPERTIEAIRAGNDGQIIRNQILSPAAPQAARLSPLVIPRNPPLEESFDQRQVASSQQDQRPPRRAAAVESLRTRVPPRKKRKVNNGNGSTRKAAVRDPIDSPEPYIKPEPESPPPPSAITLPPPKKKRQAHANVNRNARRSPTPPRRYPSYERHTERGYLSDRFQETAYQPLSRAPILSPEPRILREEPPPSRYFSDQYSRPRSPLYRHASPIHAQAPRAVSHFVEAPTYEHRHPAHEMPMFEPRYVPAERVKSPLTYREVTNLHSPQPPKQIAMMPPPTSRRLIDEQGREIIISQGATYSRAAPSTMRQSVAPVIRRNPDPSTTVRHLPLEEPYIGADMRVVGEVSRRPVSSTQKVFEQPEREYRQSAREYSARPFEVVGTREPPQEIRRPPRASPPFVEQSRRAFSVRPAELRPYSPPRREIIFNGGSSPPRRLTRYPSQAPVEIGQSARASMIRTDMPPPTPTGLGPLSGEMRFRQRTVEPTLRYVQVPVETQYVEDNRYREPRREVIQRSAWEGSTGYRPSLQ